MDIFLLRCRWYHNTACPLRASIWASAIYSLGYLVAELLAASIALRYDRSEIEVWNGVIEYQVLVGQHCFSGDGLAKQFKVCDYRQALSPVN